ncbi:MAG: hypothetical protein J6O88_09055 [Chryseobacterium sp.]|uniref:hypothetical protein n=1 Tax=Chryseobacterium sp. TaxID=1871047 RepID=UPI001B1B54E0|nr:hypothetical protein [Chryseobacterium sp.]MBO6184822.1 hypothetical protein [Chryseobacterium sp.]
MRNLILPFILLLTFIFSCRENDIDDGLEQKNVSYDVYIAGRENNKACYWKNTIKTDLNDGDNLLPLEIILENNNIYVTGSMGINPISYKTINYFWKNNVRIGIKQHLNIPNSAQSNITAFAVKNGDIYFAGYVENPAATSTIDRFELCYWKNGVKTILHKSQYISSTEGIHIEDSDVYVSALVVYNNQNTDRGYFKNMVYHSLNQPEYVLNFAKNNSGLNILLQRNSKYYYKNITSGTETLIGDYALPISNLKKILSDKVTNDLYTLYNFGSYQYYKNSTLITPNFSSLTTIQDIFALDNKIYMIKYDVQNGVYYGKVYINDVETQNISSNQNGTINYTGTFNTIFVVEN